MDGAFYRAGWILFAGLAVSYAVSLIAGSIVSAQSSGEGNAILVRDQLSAGAHDLSGVVMVPTPCDQLQVQTQQLSNTDFQLQLQTWQDPSVSCTGQETPRSFNTTLFAPSTGINITATLDGAGLPIAIVPVVASQ